MTSAPTLPLSVLDFVGIDFGLVADGRAILFEANATMNFLPMSDDPRFAYLDVARARAQAAWKCAVGSIARYRVSAGRWRRR